jgi:hypothetical protein
MADENVFYFTGAHFLPSLTMLSDRDSTSLLKPISHFVAAMPTIRLSFLDLGVFMSTGHSCIISDEADLPP